MKLIFKSINKGDQNEVLKLFKKSAEKINRLNIDHWQYWKNPPSEKIKWVEEGIENNEYFFVQNTHYETLGMVRILEQDLVYWGEQSEKAKYIHSLVVKEKYNGKGIGSLILHNVANDAKEKHCKYLRLDVDSKNLKLCKYYEKQGFKKVGIKKLPLSVNTLYQKKLT